MNYASNPKSAVIFTGGKGTRMVASGGYEGLKPLTEVNGRPFLSWLLQYLEGQKIEKFLIFLKTKVVPHNLYKLVLKVNEFVMN